MTDLEARAREAALRLFSYRPTVDAAEEIIRTEVARALREAGEREIAEVEADERHHYKPAAYQVNAVLAMVQVGLEEKKNAGLRLRALADEWEGK